MRFSWLAVLALSGALAGGPTASQGSIVLPNNPSGDNFTNATGANQGQAVGTSGWYYNNVRNSGTAGINTDYPRNSNGSASLGGTLGPGGASSKADIEYLPNAVNLGGNFYSNGSLGLLGDLVSLSYEWYRDSASTNSAPQHPAIRVLIDADGNLATTGDRGGLVFERAYNGGGPSAPTDVWTSELIGLGTNLWSFGGGMPGADAVGGFGYGVTLANWIAGTGTVDSNSAILGFSLGVGSGWGPFSGAVDNVSFQFANSDPVSFNFEVESRGVVPEPMTLVVWSVIGLCGVGLVRRSMGPIAA